MFTTNNKTSIKSINTIRMLCVDAIQRAKSGHLGTPMALAPLMYVLWQKILKYDPENPNWFNRDRLILSNGHASMLLYSILFLAKVKNSISLDDIKKFRQLKSRCAGHPEYEQANGIECTTGPLGQGLGVSVGMAIAANWQSKYFNRPGYEIINNKTYAICGDGCMMEGISSEAASLAGHLRLSNLYWLYDSNRITIDGSTKLSFTEQISDKFKAYNWNVDHINNANDLLEIEQVLSNKKTHQKPTLIIINSCIGYGVPNKNNTSAAHGILFEAEEIKFVKQFYNWNKNTQFLISDEVLNDFSKGVGLRGKIKFQNWNNLFKMYQKEYSKLSNDLLLMQSNKLPNNWSKDLPFFQHNHPHISGRYASSEILNEIANKIPWFIGGSADVASSTRAFIKKDFYIKSSDCAARNIHFGVREHAMAAISNGLALSGMRPFCSTFFVFSDYLKPSLRLSALMKTRVLYIFTHDSIGVGEDGPTHQPIEHLLALRAIPNILVLRPADANEITEAWKIALSHNGPSALILTRQKTPVFDRTYLKPAIGLSFGAYVLANSKKPEALIVGTGSEVYLCLEAFHILKKEGISTRVISMPSWELFEKQSEQYKISVFPVNIKARVSVEAGSTIGWERYVGLDGTSIGIDHFGRSAPSEILYKFFNITAENIKNKVYEQIRKNK